MSRYRTEFSGHLWRKKDERGWSVRLIGLNSGPLKKSMETQLPFTILTQPTDSTCGPTCLHAIYKYYNDHISLDQVINEVTAFDGGGTLAVFLGCHALRRGYKAAIYTYNLQVFDPTWFTGGFAVAGLQEKLQLQAKIKTESKLRLATAGYTEFLARGGNIRFQDLNASLMRKYLKKGIPILTGLSSTYLHRSARENLITCAEDAVGGFPAGHFVVLYGYNRVEKMVCIAEPLHPNPLNSGQYYNEKIDRVICSILLGILTYDANLLIIEKPEDSHGESDSGK
jgi:hypothetical protein